ncbi:MAG: hypothetical protein Q8L68_00060, partial [Methylococcales bacterium]|nr:hypothetical protein [Methylococcales bacterium]
MAILLSTALVNARLSPQEVVDGGEIQIWSGTAPATADAVATGTLLNVLTLASGARTAEVLATGIVNLIGGGSGSVDTITVDAYDILGGAVPFNTSLTQTAADVAAQINKFSGSVFKVTATSSAANITISMPLGTGVRLNGKTLACTSTTITNTINGVSSTTVGGAGATAGVAAVNGITWGQIAAGVIAAIGTISGNNLATGTAGYFRLTGVNHPVSVSAIDVSPWIYHRIQGTCGTTGADYNMSSTSLVAAAPHTLQSFTITIPK